MQAKISRRAFSASVMAASGAALLGAATPAFAATKTQKIPNKDMPPVSVNYVPGVYENRYADLGGVLDTTTGLLWGYEPYGQLANYGIDFAWATTIHQRYLDLLASLASTPPAEGQPDDRAVYQAAYDVAVQRFWRVPTVFEARDAVSKGLFTFGEGGCDMYYSSPVNTQPGVAYSVYSLRWSSSEAASGLVHLWSAADGGTLLSSKTTSVGAIVVSNL